MEIEDKLWTLVNDSKYKEFLINLKVKEFKHKERNLNLFVALTSSGSIAAWTIWNDLSFLWGIIIAASQVVTVIKPYFPFHKFTKEFNTKLRKIELLNIEIEKLWYDVSKSNIKPNIAEKRYFDLKKKLIDIDNFRDETTFKIHKKTEEEANKQMKIFLMNNYNVNLKIE